MWEKGNWFKPPWFLIWSRKIGSEKSKFGTFIRATLLQHSWVSELRPTFGLFLFDQEMGYKNEQIIQIIF